MAYQTVGRAVTRVDALEKATGSALYAGDVHLPRMLHGKVLLSPFSHARILNIHPSLLPAFPGLEAQRQAWEHGVKVTGATVHLVTTDLDAGPILLQSAVEVRDDDTPDTLAARILEQEHRLYPEAIALVLDGGVTPLPQR